ncbi:MAG: PilZ domain-containing protein [Planctomycetota bacterium]|nr:PilZ domain-containing protein [Planctomycetota bacterium]
MRPPRNPSKLGPSEEPDRANLRRHGRIRCDMLTCGLGDVVDLSASGMRVTRTSLGANTLGEILDVRLQAPGLTMVVRAKVVHISKAGLLRRNLGLEFVDVTPEIARGLTEIVRVAMDPVFHEGPT